MPNLLPPYSAIDCPLDILQKYQALKNASTTTTISSATVVPAEIIVSEIITNLLISKEFVAACHGFAIILLLFVLYINQRKNNKSYALKLFCSFYIGIQLILCLISIVFQLYKITWMNTWESNILCQLDESVTPPRIFRPVSITYPKSYYVLSTVKNLLERTFYFYVLPLLLAFHRANIYCACTFPLKYKRYFKDSLLKYYYLFISAFGTAIFSIRLFRSDLLISTYLFDGIFSFIQVLSSLIHVTLAFFAVQVILKYRKIPSHATLELEGFFYLSLLPMTLSFISMLTSTVYAVFGFMRNSDSKSVSRALINFIETVTAINDQLIIDFNPTLASLLMLLFIPTYRKTLRKMIARFSNKVQNEPQLSKAHNSPSVSTNIYYSNSVKHK